MDCFICHRDFMKGDRVVADVIETFIFKPAGVEDTVNPAQVSPDELAESRKDYTRTEMAKVFLTFGEAERPAKALRMAHAGCSLQKTAAGVFNANPLMKHSIRYHRSAVSR